MNLDASKASITANPNQLHEEQWVKRSNLWNELQANFLNYYFTFLSCDYCSKRPHCHCAKESVCIQNCPNRMEVTKNTSKGPQTSHCPTCLRIGNGKNRGVSWHNFSDSIDVFCCASCEAFYDFWIKANEWKLKKELKCTSKSSQKGGCLNNWNCGYF